MKRIVLSLFLLASFVAHCQEQEIIIRSVRNNKLDLSNYNSYFWARQVDEQSDDKNYFLNDLVLKADIRSFVRQALEDRGYRLNESSPDLLVNFRVFDKDAVIKSGDGVTRSYWSEKEYTPENAESDPIKVKAGTLIISLLDRKNGKIVWQGFADGLVKDNQFDKEEKVIRDAVDRLFEDYGYTVHEYTRR